MAQFFLSGESGVSEGRIIVCVHMLNSDGEMNVVFEQLVFVCRLGTDLKVVLRDEGWGVKKLKRDRVVNDGDQA